jgi:hypothetical protein
VLPILKKSKNLPKAPAERLLDQGWPAAGAYDPIKRRMYEYLKAVKSNVHLSLEKAKHGGKKKGAKDAPAASVDNCAVFVAPEYPDWQR